MCGICFSIRPVSSTRSGRAIHGSRGSPSPSTGCALDAGISTLTLEDETISCSNVLTLNEGEGGSLDTEDAWESMKRSLSPRGPDYAGSHIITVTLDDESVVELRFHAVILHMRGLKVTRQPFVSDQGDVFLWNGEVFGGLKVESDENDGQRLFDLLQENGRDRFLSTLREIEGPYAFIYYQSSTSKLYYGRDPVGRRSLLVHQPTIGSDSMYLSSCGLGLDHSLKDWKEVSSEAIFCYDLKQLDFCFDLPEPISFPRVFKSCDVTGDSLIYPFDELLTTLPNASDLLDFTHPLAQPDDHTTHLSPSTSSRPIHTPLFIAAMDELLQELSAAVATRVALSPPPLPPPWSSPLLFRRKARIAILFSGGLDCTALALLADREMPADEEIDLINVGFENPRSLRGDGHAIRSGKKLKGPGKGMRRRNERGVQEMAGQRDEEQVEEVVVPAVKSIYDVPDRLTGIASWEELRSLRPLRVWNFVKVDVTYAEMLDHRMKVLELMRPQRTIMDLSISIAFYFASRGIGTLHSLPTVPASPPIPYTSTARILLSGLGADELLGGYSRHRKTFNYALPPLSPWTTLLAELQTDINRISTRNLGRDDRIISYQAKEARYPFLAEKVVELLTQIPIWYKCDYRFSEGVGDKMLLREMLKRLGMTGAAGFKKRAIHFGSRTAKMELDAGKVKGEDDFIL